MFDDQQQKLIEQSYLKLTKQYKNHSNVYEISAFDQNFDQQLNKLVVSYQFNFEAIALHLYFKFPQYSHRLKPQAVEYRWYQLVLSRQGSRIKNMLSQATQKRQEKNKQTSIEVYMDEDEEEQQEVVFMSLAEKLMHYQIAMKKAQQLDEEETQQLMLYHPRFIMDSQFKLERQTTESIQNLSALMENQMHFQFGSFSPPQAPMIQHYNQSLLKEKSERQESEEQEDYIEDDWEAYESD